MTEDVTRKKQKYWAVMCDIRMNAIVEHIGEKLQPINDPSYESQMGIHQGGLEVNNPGAD